VLKLPKDVVADPRHDAVLKLLTTEAKPLWEKGVNGVITLPFSPELSGELRRALAFGFASKGFEQIEKQLAREQKGLDALKEKTPASPQNERISRLLFLSNDGSERFYRDCDAVLCRYKSRLLGFRLDIGGEEMGNALCGTPKLVRAVLVYDKKAAAQVLLSLVRPPRS